MSTERHGPAEIDRPACFASLVEAVAGCRRCQGMAYAHVLGDTNGPLDASLIVVGEAPGRLGAARTGVPFRGDRSGDRLEALFDAAAIDRADVFVTNAVLCNPLSGSGVAARNRRPRSSELARCLPFLERTLALVDAPVVAALGGVALAALGRIEPHGVAHVTAEAGRPRPWAGRALVPLVHPSPRTQGRRSWERQLEDWRAVGALVSRSGDAMTGHIDRSRAAPHDPLT